MRKVISGKSSEFGGVSLGLAVLVAGVSLAFAYEDLAKLSHKSKFSEQNKTKQYLIGRNKSSFDLAESLFNSGSAAAPATLYPIAYIPNDLRSEFPRPINSMATARWSSNGSGIRILDANQNSLSELNPHIFDKITKQPSKNVKIDNDETTLRVMGFKVSNNPSSPFFLEAVYLQSKTNSGDQSQAENQFLLAEVPMSTPPPSDCNVSITNPKDGKIYPNRGDAVGGSFNITADKLSLAVNCNYVVTHLSVYNNGTKVTETTTVPTAANFLSANYQAMIPPITLEPSGATQNIEVLAQQVDGTTLRFALSIDQKSEVNPAECSHKCSSTNEIWACTRSYWVHRDWYQNMAPETWVCYQCDVFMGFDPKNKCKGRKVGNRGNGGCFAEDTEILMADSSQRKIKDIRPGDYVFNPYYGEPIRVKEVIAGPETAPLLEVHLGDKSVRVTQEHPFITRFGPVAAKSLKAGDFILDIGGEWTQITSVKTDEPQSDAKVWNLVLDADQDLHSHLLVGDGIVSGDLYLQKRTINSKLVEFAFNDEDDER